MIKDRLNFGMDSTLLPYFGASSIYMMQYRHFRFLLGVHEERMNVISTGYLYDDEFVL